MSDPNGNREIETVVDVREFYSADGQLWLELFPYVFAPVDRDGIANWSELQLLNPAAAGLVFAAHGPDTDYLAPQDEFYNGLNLLVESVDWLRDEKFDFDDGSSLARLLGTITIGRSHDPVGALWIDRLKWIDENIDIFTEKSVDSLRRVDFDRNRKIMHEVNWLSVFFNPSNERKYPRSFTQTELVGYGIDEWSAYFALQFPRGDSDWKTFYEKGCGNSILRDICEAHFRFEMKLDFNGRYPLRPVGIRQPMVSRDESRRNLLQELSPSGKLRIVDCYDSDVLPDIASGIDWMMVDQALIPFGSDVVKSAAKDFAEFAIGQRSSAFSEADDDWMRREIGDKYLVNFVHMHPQVFDDYVLQRFATLEERELPPEWRQISQWVYDEVYFLDYEPIFNPTGTRIIPSVPATLRFGIQRGDFASNAVLALSEFIRRLPRTHFEAWVEESGKVFPNGFSHLADLAVIAEEMNPIGPITKDTRRNSKDSRIAFWDLRNGEVMGIVTISADGKVTCDNEELFMNMIMGLTAEELLSWYSSRSNGYNFQSKLIADGVTPEPLPWIEGGEYIPTEE